MFAKAIRKKQKNKPFKRGTLNTKDILKNGLSFLIWKLFLAFNSRVSGRSSKHRKKFKKDRNADKKNGALTSISPIKPPITV